MLTDIQSDPGLLERLRRAATVKMTREQRHRQMISFIHGQLPHSSTLTYADIENILNDREAPQAA